MKPARLLALALAALPAAARAGDAAADRLLELERRVGKLEGAPAKTSLSAFNPALGLALDFAHAYTDGHANFNFRAAELSVEAPVDPFLKGWAVITGSQSGVEVEEAALQTTALPYNLTVTGGRQFASFGRLAHWHDHEMPTTDRPRSLETFVGGETQADGVELSWLVPVPFYLNATAGAFNKMGGENSRVSNATARPLDNFTYTARLATYADLGDDHSVELGLSEAWTPKRFVVETATPGIQTRKNTWRTLTGVDLTYRYHPVQGGMRRGLVWGTEVLQNVERRFDASSNLPTDRVRSYAGYSYVEFKAGRRWRPGAMVDLTEDLDAPGALTRTVTAFLTFDLTEFQRLRASYARSSSNRPTAGSSDTVGLQWTGVLGHHVHGFRDR